MPQPIRGLTIVTSFVVLSLGLAAPLQAQRGRGPSEEVRARSGAYFVTAALPAPAADTKGRLELSQCEFVVAAEALGSGSLLYLVDQSVDQEARQAFEEALFQDAELSVLLRLFQCARVDLAVDGAAAAGFGKQAPVFVVFDGAGEEVDQVSFKGFKAKASLLAKALEKAAGRSRPKATPAARFVKDYRDFLRDWTALEGRDRLLADQQKRVRDKGSRARDVAELEKDAKQLEDARHALLVIEAKLLEEARVPPRPEGAVRLGDRQWGGRGRGGAGGGGAGGAGGAEGGG